MSEAMLARLLDGALTDHDTGLRLSVPTRQIVIADGLSGEVDNLLDRAAMPRNLAVISDPATRGAIGPSFFAELSDRVTADIVLTDRPHPDMQTVERVLALSATSPGLISVGSGSITDIVKYAAHLSGKPFVAFPTALSMNGYTSMNAAITVDGHKKTLPATSARAVFFDLRVLTKAPVRMIRAGFADSLARATAQTDWLMAHLLLGLPYRSVPFVLLADDEPRLVANAGKLIEGDSEAMAQLARTLTLSGFGMTICGGSYPASQGEHLISHVIEMLGDPAWPQSLHGEQIAVTTLTMARLQERLMAQDTLRLRPDYDRTAELSAFFGPELGAACAVELRKKALTGDVIDELNVRLATDWPDIRRQLQATLGSSQRLLGALAAVGAPTTPADIRVPQQFYNGAVHNARALRDRFTFLDLAALSGMPSAASAQTVASA